MKTAEEKKEAIIIDDEPLVHADLRFMLEKHPEIKIIAEAGSINEAEALLRDVTPDIVFLDIQLRGGTGFDLVPEISPKSQIIFFTAHDEYAVRAFEVNALDYLLKPVSADRLAKAIKRLDVETKDQVTASKPVESLGKDDQIFIKTENDQRFISVDNISAIISIGGNYSNLRMLSGLSHTIRRTLKQWEEMLPKNFFIRIHRSSFINTNQIKRLKFEKNGTCMISVSGIQEQLEVSRRFAPQIKELAKLLNLT